MGTYEENVVLEICRNNGVDDTSDNAVVQNLKRNLEQSLQVLHEDLYSRPAHFILELIQNADDNTYDEGVTPELQIDLHEEFIELRCNEVGFTEENVRAFCAIGKSTKKNQLGYIGEKGIGVKSMFQVAKRVYVQSCGYSFYLDRDDELGMISPRWAPELPPIPGWTRIQLRFCDDKQFTIVKEQLEEVRSTVLLFMRRLTHLCINVPSHPPFIARREINGDIVTIHMTGADAPSFSFIRIAEEIPSYRSETKRPHSTSTEIVLAFPLSSDGQPWMGPQAVYAFLPLKIAGFTFMIQADFLTTANREDILWKLPWNEHIRDNIAQVFLSAILRFTNNSPHLELTWLRFLPLSTRVKKDFFAPVVDGILNVVRQTSVVKCTDSKFREPASVKLCGNYDYGGTVLIPPEYLPFHYADFEYPDDVKQHLTHLGVDVMTFSDFVDGLVSMGQIITQKDNVWLETVCYLICQQGTSKQARDSSWNLQDPRIRNLPLAQLRDGEWTRPGTRTIFFDEKNLPFPDGLDISLLRSHSASPWRRQLLERLGIKDVDESIVVDAILNLHRGPSPSLTEADMLEHALYVFERRHTISRELKHNSLWLPNTNSNLFRGNTLYISNPQSFAPLRDILWSPAEFIHDSFLSPQFALLQPSSNVPDWLKWLQTNLGVSSSLRVDSTGRPAQEFKDLVDRLRLQDSRRFLIILKENWPGIQEQLTPSKSTNFFAYFSQVRIRCCHDIDAFMSSTTLPYDSIGQLAADDLPQLPVPEPLHDWEFLSRFGVSITQDATFYLKSLIAVSKSGDCNPLSVRKLYKQLEARFNEIPSQITVEFRINNLILVEGKWLSLSQVVWDGPAVMKLKTPLKPIYSGLDELFHIGLKIPDASESAIADELRDFALQHRSRAVPEDSYNRLIHLLEYAAGTIALIKSHNCEDWTRKIFNVPFLPVRRPGTSSTMLASREGQFYLADISGTLEEIFAKHVPFVDIRPEHAIRLRPLFEHLDIEGKRIERCVTETVFLETRPLAAELEANYLLQKTNYPETEFYRTRLPFLQRLQFYRLPPGTPLIRSIHVCSMKQIAVSYQLRGQRSTTLSVPRQCFARVNNGQLQLFILSTLSPQQRRGSHVANALATCLGLTDSDIPIVATVLRFEPAELNELLRKSGVRDLDPASVPPPPPPLVDEREGRTDRLPRSGPSNRQSQPPTTNTSLPPQAILPPRPDLAPPTKSATPSLRSVEPANSEPVLPGFVPNIRAVTSPTPSAPPPLPLTTLGAFSGSHNSAAHVTSATRLEDSSRLSASNPQTSSTRSPRPLRNDPPLVEAVPRVSPSPIVSPPPSRVSPSTPLTLPERTSATAVRSPPAASPVISPPVLSPSTHIPSLPSTEPLIEIAPQSPVHQRSRSSPTAAEGHSTNDSSSRVTTAVPFSVPRTVEGNAGLSPTITTHIPRSRWLPQEDVDAKSFISTEEGGVAIEYLRSVAEQMDIPAALTSATHALTPFETPPSSPSSSPTSSPTMSRLVATSGNRSGTGPATDARVSSVGFLGEKLVYDLLQHRLPSFGYENWTSELRMLAGFPELADVSLADFTYRDTEGALTAMLFPEDARTFPLLSEDPEYLIEVKATSGDQSEPFYMSRSQFQMAFRLSRFGRVSPAKQVYLLFRISGLRSGAIPELKVHDDPHAMLAQGILRIESEEVQVRIV